MAYLSNYQDDEKKKLQEDGSAGVNTSGVIGGADAGSAVGAQEQQAKTPGTGYMNLNQYLQMNQGQGAGVAQAATADLSAATKSYDDTAKKTLTDASSGFDAAAQKAKDTANGIGGMLSYKTAQNLGTVKDFLGAGYDGPQASDYQSQLAAAKGGVTDKLSNIDDFATQQANISAQAAKNGGNYGQGYGLLDTFLMRGDKSGQDALASAKANAGAVENAYGAASTTLTQQQKAAEDALKQSQQGVQNYALQEKMDRERGAQQRADQINAQYANQKRQGFTAASKGDTLSAEQQADLQALSDIAGMTPEQYQASFNAGTLVPAVAPQGASDKSNRKGSNTYRPK